MAKPENRSQLMTYFGAEQRNTVWSWCAVNEAEKKVYLSVWTDHGKTQPGDNRKSYILQEPHWGEKPDGAFQPARKDHDEKLDKVFESGYEAFGYFVEPKSRNTVPREIKNTRTSFVLRLELKRLNNGIVIGYPLERVEVA